MTQQITKEKQAEICNLYKSGMSMTTIFKHTGITERVLSRILSENNVVIRKFKINKEEHKNIVNLYLNKMSTKNIGKKYNVTSATICDILKNNNIDMSIPHRKYDINNNFIEEIITEEQAYFLGLMYSDGCVTQDLGGFVLALQECDDEILHKIAKLIYKKDYHLSSGKKTNPNGSISKSKRLNVYSFKMVQDLVKHGCTPAKTFTVSYPSWLPDHLHRHFIRGCWDGDGCLSIQKTKTKLDRPVINYTGTELLINGFVNIFNKKLDIKINEFNVRKLHKAPDISSYTVRILTTSKCENISKILDFLYNDTNIYMERKYKKYLELKKLINLKMETNSHLYGIR